MASRMTAQSTRMLLVFGMLGVVAARLVAGGAAVAQDPQPDTIVLVDDFDDSGTGKLPKTSPNPARFAAGYVDGEYFVRNLGQPGAFLDVLTLPGEWSDSSIAVDGRLIDDPQDRYVAVGCRSAGTNHYRLRVEPARQQFRLSRLDDGRETRLVSDREDAAIQAGTETNRLELVCVGSTIAARINGMTVAVVQDSTHQQGRSFIAVGVVQDTLIAEARFDNLAVVYAPEPPAAPPIAAAPPARAGQTQIAQPGAVIVSDDFSDPMRAALPRMSTNQAFSVGYENGEYVVRKLAGTRSGRPVVRLSPSRDYTDAALAFDARLIGDTTGRSVSLGCRRPPSGPGGYLAFIQPRSKWVQIFRSRESGIVELAGQWSGTMERPDRSHRIEISCVGNTIAVNINGMLAAVVQDDTYREGRFDLGLALNDETWAVEGRIDNMAVTFSPAPTSGKVPELSSGTALYTDDFRDPAGGVLPMAVMDEVGRIGYGDDEYIISGTSAAGSPRVTIPGTHANTTIALDARIMGNLMGRFVNIYCRISRDSSGTTGYRLAVEPERGLFFLDRFDGMDSRRLVERVQSSAIRTGSAYNRIELSCVDERISATVNGVVVVSLTDSTYKKGLLEIGVSSYDDVFGLAEVHLSNLIVTQR